MKNLFWVLLSAFAALLFVACDDDGASAKKSDDGEEVAHVVDTLYVFSKDTVYFVDTTHYVDTVVVRDSIYSYGLDGTSCTTSSVGDTAVMIVCGKDTAYVYNGQDASSKGLGTYIVKAVRQGTYDPSKDGSCSLKDYGKYVELKCGNMVLSLYAAECMAVPMTLIAAYVMITPFIPEVKKWFVMSRVVIHMNFLRGLHIFAAMVRFMNDVGVNPMNQGMRLA